MAKSAQTVSEGKQITYKELLRIRESEMQNGLRPGFTCVVKDPGTSGRQSYVDSGTVETRFKDILAIGE